MNKFFFQNDKKDTIVQYLLSGINRDDNYHLILVSCYFKLDAAEKLIEELNTKVSISKISVYIDRGAAINLGQDCINKWIDQIPKSTEISFLVSNCGSLFHPKAYCLLPEQLEDLTCARLVIGSANLTGNGLTSSNSGNVELLYGISDTNTVYNFYQDLIENGLGDFIDISELENFETDDYSFKYALVQEGCFVQNYNLTAKELLTFTYKFNKKGQEESRSKEFNEIKLENKNSYSKNYFKDILPRLEKILQKYNPSYDVQWGRYGLSTDFGCWIPKKIVAYLNQPEEKEYLLQPCKEEIEKELYLYLETAEHAMREDWMRLLQKDWLSEDFKPIMHEETDSYVKRQTKNNLDKMIRDFLSSLDKLLLRYYQVKIPFDFTNQEDVEEIYDYLQKSCQKVESEVLIEDLVIRLTSSENINSLIREYFGSDKSHMLLKCLYLTILTRKLAFIRYLNRQFYIDYVERNKASKGR
ncbi:hypothetical protein NIES2101_42685 [Calothrix sp. HK-06]|nr:hypothetical protein NIES2101_42685 [Calothrix sp. HK-06]